MTDGVEVSSGRRVRRWHPISENLKIVKLASQPGVSVAEVARANGVNANQVFTWRRAFERGELIEPCAVAEAGSTRQDRYSKSEVRFVATVSVGKLQAGVDQLGKRYRELNTRLQELNWKAELI